MFASAPPEAAPAEAVSRSCDPPDALTDTLTGAVRAAFRAALQLDEIGDHDDFFDLGGDSILAVELFLHLQRHIGREYPMAAIYDAPCVAGLVRLLAADAVPARDCAILLRPARPGCNLQPLFVVHGIDGVVVNFADFATRIEDGRAIYALAPREVDADAPRPDRVEEMASLYLDALRAIQSRGPYFLVGYSFGGLVALDIACRLQKAGEAVARLILLDTVSHPCTWPLDARLYTLAKLLPLYLSPRTMVRATQHYTRKIAGMPRGSALPYVTQALARLFTAPLDVSRAGFLKRIATATSIHAMPYAPEAAVRLPTMAMTQAACTRAYHAYRPGRFTGTIDFIKATSEDFVPFSPRLLWRRYAAGVRAETLPCGHVALMRAGAPLLAQAVSSSLRLGQRS